MGDNISILIVEDEALIAENIKMQLEDFGYEITAVCYNYDAALTAIKAGGFDVLITDINLGHGTDKKSGLQLADELKKIKKCPFIFLTAFSDKDTIKKAAALFPSAYLVKPVNAANLYASLQLGVENFKTLQSPSFSSSETQPEYFFIKHGSKLLKIFWEDIYHLEAVKNYVKIKIFDMEASLMLRGSLQQVLQNQLPVSFKQQFIKINRAEAIAKSIITRVDNTYIETTYGQFKISNDFNKANL